MKLLKAGFLLLVFTFISPIKVLGATASLTPAAKDFGNVTIGSQSTQVFTLTYTGVTAGALTVTSATASGAPFVKILDGCTGISIAASGGTCTISIQFAPTAVATSSGTLTVVTNATDGTTKISSLVGTGTTGPSVTASLSPTTFAYGNVSIGSMSANTFTLTNTGGTANLTIASATVAAPFTKTSDTCTGASIPAAGTCTIEVTYLPTALTTSNGTLTVVTNATDGTTKIATLNGSGIAGPSVTGSMTPSNFNYGNVTIGSTNATTFTITNTGGTVNLNITSATVSGVPFLKTADTCTGTSLPLAGTCTVEVTYFPTATAVSLGTLTVLTNATDGTSKISTLVGTGVTGPTVTGSLSPASFAFGNVTIGTAVPATFTLTNTGGTVNLTVTSATVSAVPFLKTADTCTGSTLTFGQTCTVEVTYFPTAATASAGVLTLVTNATDGTNKIVSFTGTGVTSTTVTATIAPLAYVFQNVSVGSIDSHTFTVTNTGGVGNLNIGTVTLSAGSPFLINGDNCAGASLAPSATCTLNVVFSPVAAGTFAGTLTVVTNASNGINKVVSLSGATSSAGTIQFSSPTYQFINDIGTATIYVTRIGGTEGTVSVNYTTQPGTASKVGGDYDDKAGTLSWSDGSSTPQKITIKIHQQTFDEKSRSFSVILSPNSGNAVVANGIASIQLFDLVQNASSSTDDTGATTNGDGGCNISRTSGRSSNTLPVMLALLVIILSIRRRYNRKQVC